MSTLQQVVQPTLRISRRWFAVAASVALCAAALVLVLASSGGNSSAPAIRSVHVSKAAAQQQLSRYSGPRYGEPGGYNVPKASAQISPAQAQAELFKVSGPRYGLPGGYRGPQR